MPANLKLIVNDEPDFASQTPEQEVVAEAIRAYPTLVGWFAVWCSDPVTADLLRDLLQIYLRGSQVTAAEASVCRHIASACPRLRTVRRDLEGLRLVLLDVLPKRRVVSDDDQLALEWTELQGNVGEWRCVPLTGGAA